MIQAARISLYGNILLFLMKAATLIFVNSLAILTDLGVSLVGVVVSVILYYAVKIANRPADLLHNFGYGKIENVCEAMEGVVLTGLAFFMIFQAAANLLHPRHIEMPEVGLACGILSTVINFAGAYFILNLGKKTKSPAINAEGVHYELEGFISFSIAIAFTVSMILKALRLEKAGNYIDPLAAMIASVIILIPSFRLARNAFFKLLDASIEEMSQVQVLKRLGHHAGRFCDFRDIKTRSAGRKKFIELKLVLPDDIPIKEGHKVISDVEKDLMTDIADCEVLVKMEPCAKDCHFYKKNLKCPYNVKHTIL
jgi:cation diffusion facilitator family transporter